MVRSFTVLVQIAILFWKVFRVFICISNVANLISKNIYKDKLYYLHSSVTGRWATAYKHNKKSKGKKVYLEQKIFSKFLHRLFMQCSKRQSNLVYCFEVTRNLEILRGLLSTLRSFGYKLACATIVDR